MATESLSGSGGEIGGPLPPGWGERVDAGSGRIYYANLITKKSQWDKPTLPAAAFATALQLQLFAADNPPQEPDNVDDAWEEREDAASGRIYYVNVITRASQWDKPPRFRPLTPQEPVTPPATETGLNMCGFCHKPSALLFECPFCKGTACKECFTAIPDDVKCPICSKSLSQQQPETQSDLPPDWEESFDPNTGRIYYVNVVTKESSWEKPTATPPPKTVPNTMPTTTTTATTSAAATDKTPTAGHSSFASLRPLKFVIVGDGAVGKTCLLISYTQNAFPEDYIPTVFDNYSCNISLEGKSYNLNLWDTAGQEEYDRLRPLSYPGTDIFVLCFSISSPSSLDNCRDKWKTEINHHCPDALIILAGCKKDLRNDPNITSTLSRKRQHPVTFEEGVKLARDLKCVKYMECSARTREGLVELIHESIRLCVNRTRTKSNCTLL
ncbi:rac gtpase [Pelomyxa schiedti]|nr:rac gtpase [Pelomyxa schiedti]